MNSQKTKKYLTGLSALMLVFSTVSPYSAFAVDTKTTKLSADKVAITVGTSKAIEVTGLTDGDIIKVYTGNKTGTSVSCTVNSGTSCDITSGLTNIIVDKGGKVYVTVDSDASGKIESDATVVSYLSSYSNTLAATNIDSTVNYASGYDDLIKLKGLAAGDVVKVYAAATGGSAISTKTVASGATTVTVSGEFTNKATGSAFVSIAKDGYLESQKRLAVKFTSDVSTSIGTDKITATNNLDDIGDIVEGDADTLEITGLEKGDVVKIYDNIKNGGLIDQATVASGATSHKFSGIAVLPDSLKAVYVTVKKFQKVESKPTKVAITATASTAPNSKNIIVLNDDGNDRVRVKGLTAGTLVVLAQLGSGKEYIPFAADDVATGKTAVTITLGSGAQLSASGGDLYVATIESGKFLSKYTKVKYVSEN